jgi:hypothetical protein
MPVRREIPSLQMNPGIMSASSVRQNPVGLEMQNLGEWLKEKKSQVWMGWRARQIQKNGSYFFSPKKKLFSSLANTSSYLVLSLGLFYY